MKIFICLLILLGHIGCTSSGFPRKTHWTVAETKKWYESYQKDAPNGQVLEGILYQGTDNEFHHFTLRVLDEWVFFDIKKEEIELKGTSKN